MQKAYFPPPSCCYLILTFLYLILTFIFQSNESYAMDCILIITSDFRVFRVRFESPQRILYFSHMSPLLLFSGNKNLSFPLWVPFTNPG